jgi:hypothetical protein
MNSMTLQDPLTREFERIRDSHGPATLERIAREITGPSVIRVFRKGTRLGLLKVLTRIPVDELRHLPVGQFNSWYERQLGIVARQLSELNSRNQRVQPGLKWGHGAKVLSLYLCYVVLHSRYFSDREVSRLAPWLHVPVDGLVMARLRVLGCRLPFRAIREIDSTEKFYIVQDMLQEAAEPAGVPRVWFDDNWAVRDAAV